MTAHVLQFVAATAVSSLVYHALRRDDLRAALIAGGRRTLSFLLLALVFGAALQAFTIWL